ncbi:hypothetical protein ACP70R_030019 [Stipagrostis hirtigluma subsp. patula]
MPPRRRGVRNRRAARAPPAVAAGDRLSALPDDVLHHLLSFLPAQEAVRTCVLARRWRALWRSATGLLIACGADEPAACVKELREFVDHLLLLRGGSPLDTCELWLFEFEDDDMPRMNLWIRHILMCKVQVLSLNIHRYGPYYDDPWLQLDELPLVSQHLRRLELSSLQLNDSFVDFSYCPALEILEFRDCDFVNAYRISSQSLKCLSFNDECYFDPSCRTRIYAPNLVSLWLEVGYTRTPLLERMPSLVDAVVKLDDSEYDCCDKAISGDCKYEKCSSCYGAKGDTNNCVLLQGLSKAQSLALISDVEIFIFRRDLKRCPIFSNLKTLLLNEYWCVPADLSALLCILEHSPVLEKLTLQLFCKESKGKVKIKGSPEPTQRSASICEHLKMVEVKCKMVDERVLNVLKFLSKLNIRGF